MRAPFWHGGLRKDKWEYLMNAGFHGPPGIADRFPRATPVNQMPEKDRDRHDRPLLVSLAPQRVAIMASTMPDFSAPT
jgi:hypothetical protein